MRYILNRLNFKWVLILSITVCIEMGYNFQFCNFSARVSRICYFDIPTYSEPFSQNERFDRLLARPSLKIVQNCFLIKDRLDLGHCILFTKETKSIKFSRDSWFSPTQHKVPGIVVEGKWEVTRSCFVVWSNLQKGAGEGGSRASFKPIGVHSNANWGVEQWA